MTIHSHPAALMSTSQGVFDRRRKAAMIVQLLLSEGQELSLASLPEDLQLHLAREVGALSSIDRATLHAVVEEFVAALDNLALPAPGGIAAALEKFNGKLSPATLARLREEAAGGDPWRQVLALSPEDLLAPMTDETVEVAAVLMSKLPTATAAQVMALLPGERARRIAFAMSRTAKVTPDAVERIGRAIARQYTSGVAPAFSQPPTARVGAILNSSQSATREALLAALEEEDKDFAEEVRKAIFTFSDIPDRLEPTDIAKILREVDNGELILALAHALSKDGAEAEAADFILGNISSRMAENLREEIEERGKVRRADGEQAQAAIVSAVRRLAETGEIQLVSAEDEDDD